MGKDTEVLTCAARCQVRSAGYNSVKTDCKWLTHFWRPDKTKFIYYTFIYILYHN